MNERSKQIIIVVGIIALFSMFAISVGIVKVKDIQLPTIQWPNLSWLNPFAVTQTEFPADLPVNVIVHDDIAGGTVSTATVVIYRKGETKAAETLTTGTDGSKTGSSKYVSGDILDIQVVKSNSKTWFLNVEVPVYDTAEMAAQKSAHDIELDFWTLGTYSIAVLDSNGDSIADTGDLNKTVLGNTPSLSVTIRNTVDDTGFRTSDDIIEGYMDQALCFIEVTGTGAENVVVKSPKWAQKDVGTDRWWAGIIADEDLTRILNADGTMKQEGAYSFTLELDLTSYSGDAADLVLYAEAYTSWTYFDYYSSFGVDAVQLDTHTINLTD